MSAINMLPRRKKNKPRRVKAVEREYESTIFPNSGERITKKKPLVIFATDKTVALIFDSISRFIVSKRTGKEKPHRKAFRSINGINAMESKVPRSTNAGAISKRMSKDFLYPKSFSTAWACLDPTALES